MADLTRVVRATSADWKIEGRREEYRFPADWDVREWRLAELPPATDAEVRGVVSGRFRYRGGEASLAELARGKRRVAIVVDDLSRPTPAAAIVPHVLSVLADAGVGDGQVRFLFAIGTHKPLTREEMALKLGAKIAASFPCENHDAFSGETADVGTTPMGTRVRVNRAVADADLVIGIGTISRHQAAHASGGGKIILPGVSHLDTILENHRRRKPPETEAERAYGIERADIDDAARVLAEQTDLVVLNALVNTRRQLVRLHAGDSFGVWRDNVAAALKLYELDFDPGDCGEGGKADLGFFRMGLHAVQPAQMGKALAGWHRVCRIPVVIGDLSDRFYYNGQAEGPYDEFLKGLEGVEALPNPPIADALSRGRPRIVYSPNLDLASTHRRRPSLYVAHDWDALIAALYEQLGPGRSVAFFHDATMHVLKTKER